MQPTTMFRCRCCGFCYRPDRGYLTPPHNAQATVSKGLVIEALGPPCPGTKKPCSMKWVNHDRN